MERQSEKNLLNSNISAIYPHNMVNFGSLTAETRWRVWGTPPNFIAYQLLLHRRRSRNANQTLRDVWPSPALVHYLYKHFRQLLPITEFCQVQNSLCIQVLHSPILVALLYGPQSVSVSQILRRSAEGATYIRQVVHHFGHEPTF